MAGKRSEHNGSAPGKERVTTLGLWGWILTSFRILSITIKLAWKLAKSPFTSRNGFSMYKYAVYQGMLDYQCGLDAVSIQNILPPTAKTCASIAKKHRIPHRLLHLDGGAVASRLGGENASKALLYFHGGGYMATALPHHVLAALGFGKSLPDGLAVFILHYSLASEDGHHYPLQLQQAVSLLDHVLHKENIPAVSTSLAGDSAGAHLIISLLLHLSHPSPQVPQLSISGKLFSAALISPWIINPNSNADSLTSNADKDIIEKSAIEYWIRNFLGPLDRSEPQPWALPLTAPQSWWTDLKIGEILVLYGQNEVLRDDAARFCGLLKAGHAQAETVEVEGELHTHLILNRFLYINEACESERLYLEWYKRHT